MKILEKPLEFYLKRLRDKEYFSFPGFSDSEWFCMMGERIGTASGFGQTHTKEAGELLLESVKINQDNYFRAVPKVLPYLPAFCDGNIDRFLEKNNISEVFYERDMITDELAERAGLFPLIDQLRKMNCVFIGNEAFAGKLGFLKISNYYKTSSPNFHMDVEGMNNIVENIRRRGVPAVYLFSSGISAGIMIGKLHGMPNSFFLDLGSIWDAFIGIGGQREWRDNLYNNETKLNEWKRANLKQYYGEQRNESRPSVRHVRPFQALGESIVKGQQRGLRYYQRKESGGNVT